MISGVAGGLRGTIERRTGGRVHDQDGLRYRLLAALAREGGCGERIYFAKASRAFFTAGPKLPSMAPV